MKKKFGNIVIKLEKIVGGGQAMGTTETGKKVFAWGGLPGENVVLQITKNKSNLVEGIVIEVVTPSPDRIEPTDSDSYLSTSPWQIMNQDAENKYKIELIKQAFELHKITLPEPIDIFYDGKSYGYRNKMEYSFYWDKESEKISLAFYQRGSHNKIPITKSSLAMDSISKASRDILRLIQNKTGVEARDLKTLLIRSDQSSNAVAQLYVKRDDFIKFGDDELAQLNIQGFELIYSNPKSPASVITKRLQYFGSTNLSDDLLGVNFKYSVEGFFQVNLSVYEQVLKDIKSQLNQSDPVIDLYSGVGTIGLSVTTGESVLIENNESAVEEMTKNVEALGRSNVKIICAKAEEAFKDIDTTDTVIVDPPRAGLHQDVIDLLLNYPIKKLIYLSCSPTTQARDCLALADKYEITKNMGYNFFPRTPHIEHLIVLSRKK